MRAAIIFSLSIFFDPVQDLRSEGFTGCSFPPFFFFFFLDPAQDLRDEVSVVAPFLLFLDPVQDLRNEGCNDFSFPIFFLILCRNPEMRAAVAVNFPFFFGSCAASQG